MTWRIFLLPLLLILETGTSFAQTHAGQIDTDGILSQGEIRNPNIDYEKIRRKAERRGDERFDNPYNNRAADMDRDSRYDRRARYDYDSKWDRDRNVRRRDDWNPYYERRLWGGW